MGLLCLSSTPLHSTESRSSLGLKAASTWAICACIGLGSTTAHTYGYAITAEILKPGNISCVVIGSDQQGAQNIPVSHPLLNPLLFPTGLRIENTIGFFGGGIVRREAGSTLQQIAISIAGPLQERLSHSAYLGCFLKITIQKNIVHFLPSAE